MIAYFCLTNDLMFWFTCLPNSYVTHLTCIWDIYIFDYPSFIGTTWHIDFLHILFLIQCLLDCFVRYRNRCLGVATDVPGQFACVFNLRLTSVPAYSFTGLSIECHEFQVS